MKMRYRRKLIVYRPLRRTWMTLTGPIPHLLRNLDTSLKALAKRLGMEPMPPSSGQLWFDPARGLLMRYSGSEKRWVEVGNDLG